MKTNWQTKKLGEICDILDSKRKPITKRDRVAGEYPYYGASGILDYVKDYIFDEKLILVGEDGAKWGAGENTAFIAEGRYWVNNHAHVIRPHRDVVLDNWIVNFLNVSDLSKYTTGLTVPKLNQGKLREIEIPLPSLPEQKRIVKILNDAFEKTAMARENTEKNLQNSRELFESYLNGVFANPGKDWQEKQIKEVCEELFAGGDVPKNYSKVKTKDYTVPIFANGIQNKGLYGYTNIKKVVKPSITVSARGTIGHSEIRQEPFFPVVRLIVLVPDSKVVGLPFLYYITRSFQFSNTGSSIPQLTIPMIQNIKIKLPSSLDEQKTIVKKLDSLSEHSKKLENNYQQKLDDLGELKKSVLSKAFAQAL